MRDTIWAGRVQKMVDSSGVPKGMRQILEERGINTTNMKADDMRVVLANHEDFSIEKTLVEHYLHGEGLKASFLPKFHCELNPIERPGLGASKSLYINVHKLHVASFKEHYESSIGLSVTGSHKKVLQKSSRLQEGLFGG